MKLLRNIACMACSLAAMFVYAAEEEEGDGSEIVSAYNLTTWYNADGSAMGSNGGGGNGNPARLFDGNFTNYQMLPRCNNGGYFILDFSTVASDGYYITKIMVGHAGGKKYSIYYTENGTSWEPVPGAAGVVHSGIATYELGKIAKQIKYVFDQGSMWDYSTEYIGEVQVWGMDPSNLKCTHPTYTEWVVVPNTSTCLEKGIMERSCTVCGEYFTMSGADPLGHDFKSTLTRKGKYVAFGSGYITCTRCDFYLDCSQPIDLITNKVNGAPIGSYVAEGKYQFTDVVVSSECHPEWGPAGSRVVDNWWEEGQWSWWFGYGLNNYVDYKFGTTVDLTQIDVSVQNRTQTLLFYDYDEATGIETLLDQVEFTFIPPETNLVINSVVRQQQKQVQDVDEEGNPRYYNDGTPVMVGAVDANGNPIMEDVLDANGQPIYDLVQEEVVVNCKDQRIQHPLFEKQTSYLRVRFIDEGMYMGGWGPNGNSLIELHPWGTVPGAGRPQYRKETFILLK